MMRSGHMVGVYDRDDELLAAVAAFVVDAFDQGGTAIVIATAAHRAALKGALAAKGFSLDALTRAGRFASLDAAETLATFMPSGELDAREFDSVIGALIREVGAAGRPVHLFGEMVALLWDSGNIEGAIDLESRWNDLAAHHTFALFCAYAMSSLETSGDLAAAKRMCDRHSTVIPLPDTSSDGSAPSDARVADEYERFFVASPKTLPRVRGFVREALHNWGEDGAEEAVEVIASELATNAVRHARSPFLVSLFRAESTIRISVRDASFARPEPARRAADDGGRGIQLVAAMSQTWGTRDEADGKTVWAEVVRAPAR